MRRLHDRWGLSHHDDDFVIDLRDRIKPHVSQPAIDLRDYGEHPIPHPEAMSVSAFSNIKNSDENK